MARGLDALLTLPRTAVGRVALLRAIGELGSISAAARRAGLSYKGAWDAVQALNNLFDAPLVTAAPGGRAGGAARLTDQGHAVVAAFARVEAEMSAVRARLGSGSDADLTWSLGMRTSARNALRGQVARLTPSGVTTEVLLRLSSGHDLRAVVTSGSVEALGLHPGGDAVALIKSTFITFGRADASALDETRPEGANRLLGRVLTREDGPAQSEVVLDLGQGKTLIATIPLCDAATLAIAAGDPLEAWFEASHVILAVE